MKQFFTELFSFIRSVFKRKLELSNFQKAILADVDSSRHFYTSLGEVSKAVNKSYYAIRRSRFLRGAAVDECFAHDLVMELDKLANEAYRIGKREVTQQVMDNFKGD